MPLKDAKEAGAKLLQEILIEPNQRKTSTSLRMLFDSYTSTLNLKETTLKDYQTVIPYYLSDWMNKKVTSISKSMVEKRFVTIRDKGWQGGIPTHSQANKVMRILSALMNYAMADDIIQQNPVDVLKQKRVDRSTIKRSSYLTAPEAREVTESLSDHPVELAIAMMLYTGLRKNEALSIRWENVTKDLITIKDTKNHREHLIPITERIQKILDRIPRSSSPFLFPSPVDKQKNIRDVRPTLKRIEKNTGINFKCHDLRRTFATRASEVGIDFLMIKRMLNHKVSDITAQYIQWNSKENLQKMKEALERVVY
ncbi:tyrosine-type recombinase/integrase [Desulfocapsa sulfexigens]